MRLIRSHFREDPGSNPRTPTGSYQFIEALKGRFGEVVSQTKTSTLLEVPGSERIASNQTPRDRIGPSIPLKTHQQNRPETHSPQGTKQIHPSRDRNLKLIKQGLLHRTRESPMHLFTIDSPVMSEGDRTHRTHITSINSPSRLGTRITPQLTDQSAQNVKITPFAQESQGQAVNEIKLEVPENASKNKKKKRRFLPSVTSAQDILKSYSEKSSILIRSPSQLKLLHKPKEEDKLANEKSEGFETSLPSEISPRISNGQKKVNAPSKKKKNPQAQSMGQMNFIKSQLYAAYQPEKAPDTERSKLHATENVKHFIMKSMLEKKASGISKN
mgnify:CR=1 FL=1